MYDKIYESNIERNEKKKAVTAMINEWLNYKDWLNDDENTDKYIHVGVFNPSTTCLDLDILVAKNLIREDTKLIFFENKKYLEKKDKSDYVFKRTVMSHIPMVKPENVVFHFGELETLQLGGALRKLNAECVDFMFLDFCGELKYNHAKWLYDNRYMIQNNSFQFYTISIQSGIRCANQEKFQKMRKTSGVLGFVYSENDATKNGLSDFYRIKLLQGEKRNQDSDALRRCTDYWNFICTHILDTRTDTKQKNSIPVIVYQGGKAEGQGSMKMGIFHSQCSMNTIEEYRWEYNSGWLKPFERADIESITDEYGVCWKPNMKGAKNRVFTNEQVKLYRDYPIDHDTNNHRYQNMLNYILRNKNPRHMELQRIFTEAEVVFPTCFPEEMRQNMYRSSYLVNRSAERLLAIFMVDKVFFDEVSKQKYRFIRKDDGNYDLILENSSHITATTEV